MSGQLDDARFMELLELALRTPAEERRVRLIDACGGDDEVVEELLDCVARQAAMAGFMAEPLLVSLGTMQWAFAGIGDPPEPEVRFAPGSLVSARFLIQREVGEGGMGIVYEAIDTKVDRRCALKIPKAGFARRLPAEARSALAITHENICRIYGIYTTDSPAGPTDVLAMEYLDGETLAERIGRAGPLDQEPARAIVTQLCAGLERAHREGILHRDLKSANIMLTEVDGATRAVITDFGLAGGDGVERAVSAGTPPYMAPELLEGASASPASDLYALGVVIYEMVTGTLPGRDGARETPVTPPTRLVPALDRSWDRAVARCLIADPSRRVASAADVARGFDRARAKRRLWTSVALASLLTIAAVLGPSPRPLEPVRLALLPFETPAGDDELAALAGGTLHDLSDRFRRTYPDSRSLLVIPVVEALKYKVSEPARARNALGATHVLKGRLDRRGGAIVLTADIVDAHTLVSVRKSSSQYPADRTGDMLGALAGTLTAGLELHPLPIEQSIAPAAYTAFANGMFHLRAASPKLDVAIRHLEESMQLDDRSALPLAALAEAFAIKHAVTADGRWIERARAALERAEARQPDSVAVRLASGRVNRASGNLDAAIADYRRVIQIEPENVVAWLGLARAYEAAGTRASDAAAAYRRAVELQPDYYLPVVEFGNFYQLIADYTQAEAYLRRAITIAPEQSTPYTNLGALFVQLGRFAEAEVMLRQAIAIQETTAAVNNLGAALNYQGRDVEALALYRRMLAAGPPNFVILMNIGDSCRRSGSMADARAAYTEGLELADREVLNAPGRGYPRAFVAYFMARLDDRRGAHREIAQALRLSPNDVAVMRRAALTFAALGDEPPMLSVLARAPAPLVRELSRHPDIKGMTGNEAFRKLVEVRQ